MELNYFAPLIIKGKQVAKLQKIKADKEMSKYKHVVSIELDGSS